MESWVVESWIAWVAVGLAAWAVLALVLGLLLGRVIHHRDRQVPRGLRPLPSPRDADGPPAAPPSDPPAPAPGPSGSADRPPRRAS